MGGRPARTEEEWLSLIDRGKPNECWGWRGHHAVDGHAKKSATIGDSVVTRWLWKKYHGPIPDGYEVDHKCRVRGCVNWVRHLRLLPKPENMRIGKGFSAVNARKEVCVGNHPLSGPGSNVRINTAGSRVCRHCRNQRERDKRAAKWLARRRGDAKHDT